MKRVNLSLLRAWTQQSRCRASARLATLPKQTPTTVRRQSNHPTTTTRLLCRRRLVPTPHALEGSRATQGESTSGRALGVSLTIVCVTLGTKALGLAREAALAAEFGLGAVAEGIAVASLLPSLAGVLLGGVNGAFHSAVVAVAARQPPASRDALLEEIWGRVGPVLAGIALLVAVWAELIVSVTGPGLSADVRNLASAQLVAMAPTIWLSGRVGLGFGALSASGNFWLPAASSAVSSAATLAAVAAHRALAPLPLLTAGVLIASAMPLGSALQWGLQVLLKRSQATPSTSGVVDLDAGTALSSSTTTRTYETGERTGGEPAGAATQQVLLLLLPSVASLGVLQLAVLTDVWFASFEPGTAAAMGYANLLAMAPLGVLSSAVLLPVLPALAALSNDPPAFWSAVSDSAIVALTASALLAAWLAGVARPLVEVAFMRAAFDSSAATTTAQLLIAYAAGTPFYLLRDVYTRAFFALGDSTTPFLVSVTTVALNAVLDWFAFFRLNLGGPGLVLATAVVNAASALILAVTLRYRRASTTCAKVQRSPFHSSPELRTIWRSAMAGTLAAVACHCTCTSLCYSLGSNTTAVALLALSVGSLVCVSVFGLATYALGIRDLWLIWQRRI